MHFRDITRSLGAAILFGTGAPFAKALAGDSGAQVFAGILYLGSGFALAIASQLWVRAEEPLHRHDFPWLAASTLTGGIIAPVLLVWGLQHTSGSAASLLLNVEVVLTAVVAWIAFGEHRHARTIFGLVLVVGGGVLLSWSPGTAAGSTTWAGGLAVAGACFFWAVDNNVTQPISMRDPFQIAMWKGLVAGTTNVALGLILRQSLPDATQVGGGLLLGALSYGASLVLFVSSLRRMGTARTAAFFAVAPFVGAATAIAFWGEPVTLPIAGAVLLMAAGIALYATERHGHRHVHEPFEHAHQHVHDDHHSHEHGASDPPGEPHSHLHRHERLEHEHPHTPDIHHRHRHEDDRI